MIYSALPFVECGTETTHVLVWDSTRGRWVMPCGLYPTDESRAALFCYRLCRTCDDRTQQVIPKVSR